jgi:hypothetical protein
VYNKGEKKYLFMKLEDKGGDETKPNIYRPLIALFDIPLGSNCADCNKNLVLPYYYGIDSKKHRCIECTEKQD